MSVEVWRFERSATGHESAALLRLARALDGLAEQFLMIIHPVLGSQEIDALVFKEDMVFVVEIKSAHGPVVGKVHGTWHVLREDGSKAPLNAGREDNPFWQVQKNYFAARDFLEEKKSSFMTESEAAVLDFKKIKNILIFDPEYDETTSDIRLGRDYWKVNIVGLHDNVGDPFFSLRHRDINLPLRQARAFARNVLNCSFAKDYEAILHQDRESKTSPQSDQTAGNLEPRERQLPSTKPETAPAPSRGAETHQRRRPSAQAPKTTFFLPNLAQSVKDMWGALSARAGQGTRRIRQHLDQERERWRATHKIDFERLLQELQRAADDNIHNLTPDIFVANYYTVHLDTYSYDHVRELRERYEARAVTEIRRYIVQQGYKLDPRFDRIVVEIAENPEQKSQIEVTARYKEAPPIATIEGVSGQGRNLYAGEALTIGRAEGMDYRICDNHDKPVISRRHCLITVSKDGKRVTLRDESTNGTFVNGERIHAIQLTDGDVILLGRNKRKEEGPIINVVVHE
jgi:hypothetical protein